MNFLKKNYTIALLFLLLTSQLIANTHDWRNNKLLDLQKVTVGPSDNYQSSIQTDQNRLYFTRNKNQISHIFMQDLQSAKSKRLLPPHTDAKDPVVSPDNRYLAMTCFKNDAKGDIYIYPFDKKKHAFFLTDYRARENSPFWINARELGYIHQSMTSNISQLMSVNIYTKMKKVIASGDISAPSASPNGKYIVFYQHKKEKSKSGIYIYDVKKNLQFGPLQIDLPGSSSYFRFSSDNEYLYFSQYLNDTNSDQKIDGSDYSVVFRVKVSKILQSKTTILPEQLTSVDQNCNFPLPTSKYLYLTCANEGSLDIYRMPLSGRVPLNWSKKEIIQADYNSKSYEDRLLLLNALEFRFHSEENNTTERISLLERQLSNHLEIDELSAAEFFVTKIEALYKQKDQKSLANFYHNLTILLQLNAKALKQPAGKIRRFFALELEQSRQKLLMQDSQSNGVIFNAWIDILLKKDDSARKQLDKILHHKNRLTPIAYYLAVALSRKLLKNKPQLLLTQLLNASQNGNLPLVSRLYYTCKYLDQLAKMEPDLHKREHILNTEIKKRENQKNRVLFKNELAINHLIVEKNESKKHQIFSKLMKSLKDVSNPLIRDIAHKRAILLLKSAGKYKFMELLSRHWLIVSDNTNIGFYDIAQQYSIVTINKAYSLLNHNKSNDAANAFYSAIRQTNDLEALYNFVTIDFTTKNVALNKHIEKALKVLKKEHLLKNNINLLKALQLLMAAPKETQEHLKKVAVLLENFKPVGLTPAIKSLLLGYVYHRQLLLSQKNYIYDIEVYKKAHYQYMLALDQAYDNQRIQAAVLQNLGQLHFSVGNYSLATQFFKKRVAIPFLNKKSEALFRWHFAQSLFYYNDYRYAAKEGELALGLAQEVTMQNSIGFAQKAAFYDIYAAYYNRAATLYKKVLKNKNLSTINRAKALLGYGYTLLQLQKPIHATQVLKKLLVVTSQLTTVPANTQCRISFEPQRLQLLAYGFLASLSTHPQEKIYYLSERIKILILIKDRIENFAYDEKSRLEFLIKALAQKAVVYKENKQLQQMQNTMSQAIKLLPKYLAQNGGYNSQVIIRTLDNYISLALLYPKQFKNREPLELQPLVKATLEALTLQGYTPPTTSRERAKLEYLKINYDAKIIGQKSKK